MIRPKFFSKKAELPRPKASPKWIILLTSLWDDSTADSFRLRVLFTLMYESIEDMLAEECKERRLPVEDIFFSLCCLAFGVRCWLDVRGRLWIL